MAMIFASFDLNIHPSSLMLFKTDLVISQYIILALPLPLIASRIIQGSDKRLSDNDINVLVIL